MSVMSGGGELALYVPKMANVGIGGILFGGGRRNRKYRFAGDGLVWGA